MPFTFSHPAIVLPLNRYFSITGLVIGSIVPDIEFFLLMRMYSRYGHSLMGMFLFDLPIALLLSFIFHHFLRKKIIDQLPNFLFTRLARFRDFNWNGYVSKNILLLIMSILIGIVSHLFWDGFTHRDGYFVLRIPFLQQHLEWNRFAMPVYKIMQHGSTIIGLLVIAIAIYRLPLSVKINHTIDNWFWLMVASCTAISITLTILFTDGNIPPLNLLLRGIVTLFLCLLIMPARQTRLLKK